MSDTLAPKLPSSQFISIFGKFLHWFKTPRGRRTLTGYLFIGPFILGVLFWVVYPAGMAAWLTFQKWNLITPAEPIGFGNFQTMAKDPLFWKSLFHSESPFCDIRYLMADNQQRCFRSFH